MREQDKIDRRLARQEAAARRRRQEAELLADLLEEVGHDSRRRVRA